MLKLLIGEIALGKIVNFSISFCVTILFPSFIARDTGYVLIYPVNRTGAKPIRWFGMNGDDDPLYHYDHTIDIYTVILFLVGMCKCNLLIYRG